MGIIQKLKYKNKQQKKKSKSFFLNGCPQKKAVCKTILLLSPKKPNSAQRKVVRANIYSLNRELFAYIPGIGHSLQPYNVILIRGGRTSDLPGLRYKAIRGALDLKGVSDRRTSRSKYGVKNTKRRVKIYFRPEKGNKNYHKKKI